MKSDNTTFSELKEKLLASDRDLPVPVIAFMDSDTLRLQSRKFMNGVPMFVIQIYPDQRFVNFHLGVRCTAASLSKNRITTLKTWSALEENIRYLNSMKKDHKKQVIQQQQ